MALKTKSRHIEAAERQISMSCHEGIQGRSGKASRYRIKQKKAEKALSLFSLHGKEYRQSTKIGIATRGKMGSMAKERDAWDHLNDS